MSECVATSGAHQLFILLDDFLTSRIFNCKFSIPSTITK